MSPASQRMSGSQILRLFSQVSDSAISAQPRNRHDLITSACGQPAARGDQLWSAKSVPGMRGSTLLAATVCTASVQAS